MLAQQKQIAELEEKLAKYSHVESMAGEVYDELRLLYPQIAEIVIAKGKNAKSKEEVIALLVLSDKMSDEELARMKDWLKLRSRIKQLRIEILQH